MDEHAREEEGREAAQGPPQCIETTMKSESSLLPSHGVTWQSAEALMRISTGTITTERQDKDGPYQHRKRTAKGSKEGPDQALS